MRSQPASYTFTAKTNDYASRFRLVFSTTESDGPSTPSTGSGTSTLQVIDALGRPLITKEIQTSYFQLPTSSLPSGVYVLRLINGDDVKTQKIVVK